jgi:hypothetical protein
LLQQHANKVSCAAVHAASDGMHSELIVHFLGGVTDMGVPTWLNDVQHSSGRPCVHYLTQNPYNVRFEVFTAVTMKNGVFWVVTPCGSCKNRRFSQRTSVASCSLCCS